MLQIKNKEINFLYLADFLIAFPLFFCSCVAAVVVVVVKNVKKFLFFRYRSSGALTLHVHACMSSIRRKKYKIKCTILSSFTSPYQHNPIFFRLFRTILNVHFFLTQFFNNNSGSTYMCTHTPLCL